MKIFAPCFLAVVFAVAISPAFAQPRPQMRQPKTEIRTGTVKEIKHKGRARTLVVTCDGEDYSFPITPKVNVEIKLTGGDHTAIQKGAYLEGDGTFTNNRLFLEVASVRLLPPNAKTPDSKIVKPEMLELGQSLNSQHISGQIMARGTSKEYPEYEEAVLRPAPNVPSIMFKKEISVDIISSDLDEAKPDQAVELEVIPGRNDKLTLVRATIEGGEYTPPAEGDAEKK